MYHTIARPKLTAHWVNVAYLRVLAVLPVPVGEVGELGCPDVAADGRVVCRQVASLTNMPGLMLLHFVTLQH